MYLKFIFFILSLSLFAQEKNIEQQKENQTNTPEEVNTSDLKDQKKQIPDSKKKEDKEEKKISITASFGFGIADLGLQLSQRDPTYAPSEFVFNSVYAVSLISPNTANNLAGNVNPVSFASFLILNEELKKEIYTAKSDSVYNRFYVHNKTKSEETGYSFGLSSGFYSIQTDSSRDRLSFLPLFFFPNNSPLINQFTLLSYNYSKIPIFTNITTFDFFASKHFIPNDKFDFYIALGGGIGGCLVECKAFKFSPKLGAKFFLNEDFYLYLETELNYLILFDTERKYSPIRENVISFGLGLYL